MITKESFIQKIKQCSNQKEVEEVRVLDSVILEITNEGSYFIKEKDVFEFLNNESEI